MPNGVRSEGLILTLRILRIVTSRWMSLREIADELGMNDPNDYRWTTKKNAKRIRRALGVIEAAGLPLQIDTDDNNDKSNGKIYYKLDKRAW